MATYGYNILTGDEGVRTLRSVTDKLMASLDALKASATTFKSMNSGQSIDGYDQAQAMWDAGMVEMQSALGVKSQKLTEIGQGYVDTDMTGAKFFAT